MIKKIAILIVVIINVLALVIVVLWSVGILPNMAAPVAVVNIICIILEFLIFKRCAQERGEAVSSRPPGQRQKSGQHASKRVDEILSISKTS